MITRALDEGVDTIITCDNGISAAEEIAFAKESGFTVIITDHHEVPFSLDENKEKFTGFRQRMRLLIPNRQIVRIRIRGCAERRLPGSLYRFCMSGWEFRFGAVLR
ncbi:hypothetical protein C823_007193 [Eubacterium plexicaudatum ASF492]|nr:hypothetical protein C823_007193 [Eubacterium plexicaudatum ASF492]